jgi:DNA-binding HxlR family transcriptional regulator
MASKNCPMGEATKIVGDHWNIFIIRELLSGCKRFNEIADKIEDITNSTLSDRLKSLTEAGFVTRVQHDSFPPKVIYTLTERGQNLAPVIAELEKFAEKNF